MTLSAAVVGCQGGPAPQSANPTASQANPSQPSAPPPSADRSSPSASPLLPSTQPAGTLEIVGQPEVVFDWASERCADDQLADLPARAIRSADGLVSLYLSSTTSYRLVGRDFNSLVPSCDPVLESDFDPRPENFSYAEWMGSPYTLDGQTVYALVHQEFHGDQAGSAWQAGRDFGPSQASGPWRYLDVTAAGVREMTWDANNGRWQGRAPLCQIGPSGMHPDIGCDAVLEWTSPVSGTVSLSGRAFDQDAGGGNGVTVRIAAGRRELLRQDMSNGDTEGTPFEIAVDVGVGGSIRFSVAAKGDSGWDSTAFDPGIDIDGPPCPSMRHELCTLISLTYGLSSDGGATFQQPAAPDQLVAAFPDRYDADWMRSLWQPSNIVRHPSDGFFYALVQFDEHAADGSLDTQGMCVMRTQTLDSPPAWRAWDGRGFDLAFRDPYTRTKESSNDQRCTLVSPRVGALTYGLTYNDYLGSFIAVGVGREGFYYALSDDLIRWSPRQFLMAAAQTFDPGAQPPFLPYPALIDHDSPSLSFDVSGEAPYLYFSRFAGRSSGSGTDLLRVPLRVNR